MIPQIPKQKRNLVFAIVLIQLFYYSTNQAIDCNWCPDKASQTNR